MKSCYLCALITPLLALGLGGSADAQTPPDDRTAALLKKVADLETNLAEVKAELARLGLVAPAQAAAPPPAEAAPTLDAATLAAMGNSDGHDSHTLGPLQFRGYSDFGFGRPVFDTQPNGGLSGSTNSFTLGDFDLFVTANINDHLSVLGEMLVTSDFTNEFSVEMDRLLLTYSVNKYLQVSAGKYNTAIGFYTNEFHRARFFQTATGRPIMFSDEDQGGILPVHSIGLTATGELPSGKVGLHWVAEVANGRAFGNLDASPIQNFVDQNNGKAFNVALYARPEWISGLDVGVSFYRDRLHPAALSAIEQHIYSAHAAFVRPHLELIGEGVLLSHNLISNNRGFNTFASYLQASYQMHQIRPYVRYDYQNVPRGEPVFGILGRENGPSIGIRYDFADFANFKLQYGRLDTRTGQPVNDAQAQIGFAF